MSYMFETKPADPRNYNNRPGGRKPIGIMLHHWGIDGQSHDNVVAYLRRYRPANPTSAHEVISAGRVTQLVPLLKRAWHARSGNDDWIGMENRPEMSDGDWETLVERCADIERETGRSKRYGKHSDVVNTACPGRYASRVGELVNAVNANLANNGTQVKPVKIPRKPKVTKKTIRTMADEVIAGQHGTGHTARQHSLGVSAAQYKKVRAEVNRRAGVKKPKASTSSISRMATEVLAGKHGQGHARRRRSLGISAAEYAKVRAEVNRRAGGGSSSGGGGKSVSQMATEVLQGKHGNGHANRQRSLGVNNATYAKVRAEVNRRS